MKSFLFTPELTKAFIDGSKTQTRRLIKGAKYLSEDQVLDPKILRFLIVTEAAYNIGEVVYIREGFRFPKDLDSKKPSQIKASPVEFRLGGSKNCVGEKILNPGKWRSPLHHPERFARYFAKITDVKIEPIQMISDDDAIAEGIIKNEDGTFANYGNDHKQVVLHTAKSSFTSLWLTLYGLRSYLKNPWVFVYTFVKCDKNGKEL